MCNFNHTTSQVRLQADTWINKGLPFGRYNYLVNIREIECKIQSYYTKTTGTYVENNGKGYIARSTRKDSHALSCSSIYSMVIMPLIDKLENSMTKRQ